MLEVLRLRSWIDEAGGACGELGTLPFEGTENRRGGVSISWSKPLKSIFRRERRRGGSKENIAGQQKAGPRGYGVQLAPPDLNTMVKWRPLLFVAISLGLVSFAVAQNDTSGFPLDDQQTTDCSDPMNAGSLACQNTNPNQTPGVGQQQTTVPGTGYNYPRGGQPSTSSQNNSTYTDNGGINPNNQAGNLQNRQVYPPEPLTEFQRMVAASIGEILPIFGQDLFRRVPSTFAPVDQIPVTPDYVIGPGDELRVRVWGQVNFHADVRVDRSGDVYLPQVGQFHVAGLAYSGLNDALRKQIGRVFRNFDLTVELGQLRSIQIYVVGHARRPGAYTVSSLSTLVNALFESGGPSLQGSMRDIQVKRENNVVTDFDMYDLLLRGDKSKDVRLLPGDVIYIPAVGPQVALLGSVQKPAIYELLKGAADKPSEDTLGALIQDAGGLSPLASGSRVAIERNADRQTRTTMEVAMDGVGLATELRDGDLIRIVPIVSQYQKTVTLRGNLANPGRFAWTPGMKLSDLIPDRESLLTRNYWWRRAQFGLPSPEFQPLAPGVYAYQPVNPTPVPRQGQPPTNYAGQPLYPNQYPNQTGYGATNQANQINNPNYPQTGVSSQQTTQQPIPANGQYQDNLNYQDNTNYNYNSVPNSAQNTNPQAQRGGPQTGQGGASGSSLAGQQTQVITENNASADQRVTVRLPAPEIDWSYAVIERMDPLTLKTSLVPFNLGKLVIDHDATQDLPLQAGDVVTIFSQADITVPLEQQTKFVRLEGEFVSAGVYSVQPGETLRHLVARAGGLTPQAYLFGSEFTRESTRVYQQQRLDDYVQSLELQIQRGALLLASSAVTPQDSTAATAAASSQQGLLARLHQLRASGRIVLEVKPNSSGVDAIPDLPLQDDDRFIVPTRPASVNVVGSVYNQNSFFYRSERRVGDYLRLAGGPNRNADRHHAFVIRADGSVLSRDAENGLWGNNFEALRLNPGDTIVVPEKVIGASTLRGFLNWSQVFSNLAFGAASISVLR